MKSQSAVGSRLLNRGMNMWAKVTLITTLTLLVSVFMHLGSGGPRLAQAAVTSATPPTAASGTNWTNPTYALTQNAQYATFTGTTGTYLNLTGFGFAIPAGSTINSVQATVVGLSSGTTAANRTIRLNLTTNGTAAVGTNKTQALNTTVATFNTTNDLWGTTLTAANVNASTFGVLIRDNDTTTSGTFSIDYVALTITYTLEANKPTITTFTVPATSSSFTISGITLAASDDTGVTGYLINESSTPPAAAEVNITPAPTTYTTAATEGVKTLYAWARDAAGNVNNVYAGQACTVTIPVYSTLMHNSANLGTTYGNWGVVGGKYGEFTCTTCHNKTTENIKRVAQTIQTPNLANWSSSGSSTVSVTFNNMTGFGNDAGGHVSSTRICQVCHSKTAVHRYNTTGQSDLNHKGANGTDCTGCHSHADAFMGKGCTSCHGSTAASSNPMTSGKHTVHIANAVYGCADCHAKSVVNDSTLKAAPTAHKNDYYGDYSGARAGGSFVAGNCSNVYCHTDGKGGAPATAVNWSTGPSLDCKGCHGAGGSYGEPTYVGGNSHVKHVSAAADCAECHFVTTADGTTIKAGGSHTNKLVEVDGSSSIGYLGGAKTCSTASCHADPYGPGSVTSPAWGTSAGCAACHTGANVITASGPATGSHTNVPEHAVACITCHAAGTTATTAPSTGHPDTNIDVANVGYAILNKTKGTAGTTCSAASCHASPYAAGASVTTPNWGSTGNGCVSCHAGAYAITAAGPVTGSHTTVAGHAVACINCHAAGTTATTKPSTGHNDNDIDVVNVGYPANVTKHASGTGYSSCSNFYCHSYGTTAVGPFTAKKVATWGAAGSVNCVSCHGGHYNTGNPAFSSLSTGRHRKHLRQYAALTCNICHAATVSNNTTISDPTKHVNSQINVSFVGVAAKNTTPVYSDNNHAPGATTGTCSVVYCHSNGQLQQTGRLTFRNMTGSKRWSDVGTLGCGGCHGNSSGYPVTDLSGKHGTHLSLTVNPNLGKVRACGDCHLNGGGALRANHVDGMANYSGTMAGDLKLSTGRCSTVYCHSNGQTGVSAVFQNMSTNNWFSSNTLGCNGCHADTSALTSLSGKHDAHVNKVATGGNYGCADCHASTVTNNTTVNATGNHVNGLKNFSGAKVTKTGFVPGSGNCTNTCHTDGKGGTAKTPVTWTGAAIGCKDCHGGGTSQAGEPVYATGNSHVKHVGTTGADGTCQYCHADTMNGTGLNASGKHINAFINVTSGNGKVFGYTDATKTCSNISCHSGGLFASNDIQWGTQMPNDCTGCHGNEVTAATGLSGAHNAHLNNASAGGSFKCKDCHAPTISNADNRTIADANIHGNSIINYSGAKAGRNKNCSNIYCHSNGKGAFAAIPAWANGSADCQSCHSTAGLSANYAHAPHIAKGATCAQCHSLTTTAADTITGSVHIDGSVDIQQGGFYPAVPGTKAVSFQPVGTTCNNISCHAIATVGPYSNTATWGVKPNCDSCHPKNKLSGAHMVHMGDLDLTSANVYYNMTANRTPAVPEAGRNHGFGCGNCHPMSIANHFNGSIEVDLNRVNEPGVGTLRFLNHSSAGYANNKCDNMYCHSNASRLEAESNVRSNTSLTWTDKFDNYTGYRGSDPILKRKTDRCAWCHGNQPTTGAHVAHAVSNHSDNIYNGKDGKVGFSGTGNSAHGNPNTTTTITCYICHQDTITAKGNDRNDKCIGCHGVTAPRKGNAAISNLANHVNGKREIKFFAAAKIRSKAQVRPESFKFYSGVWKRSYYKNMTSIAFDEAKSYLDTATMWHPSTPMESNCSNLACHNGYPAKWNMANWNDPNKCMDCHFKL